MRSGKEMQRKDKEQGIEQIYTQILVIMGNWKNQLKSHGVPFPPFDRGWRKTSKTRVTPKRNTKTMWEKQNNQPLYTRSFKPMDSFSQEKLSK
jgi:hypothetical protein